MVPVALRAPSTMPAPQPCSVLIPCFEVTNSETAGVNVNASDERIQKCLSVHNASLVYRYKISCLFQFFESLPNTGINRVVTVPRDYSFAIFNFRLIE